jgi:hypothetical protein
MRLRETSQNCNQAGKLMQGRPEMPEMPEMPVPLPVPEIIGHGLGHGQELA